MTKKIHLVRMHDGKVIGNIQSINADGASILEAYENKKSGEYVLFDDRLEEIGFFNDSGMTFSNREVGELLREEIESMRGAALNTVPLVSGQGMLVLMTGFLEVNESEGQKIFVIEDDSFSCPVELANEPDPKMIGEYVTLVGTMKTIDGKSVVAGAVKDHDGSAPSPVIFGSGRIDLERKKFIAVEDGIESEISIDMDDDALKQIAEELEAHPNGYIAGPIHYDGSEYLFTPTAILQASVTVSKKHQPEMGMMS